MCKSNDIWDAKYALQTVLKTYKYLRSILIEWANKARLKEQLVQIEQKATVTFVDRLLQINYTIILLRR